ncbi:monovalent cation/H+ antiporter complex subunit F [Streptomyces sp. 549]|uniref:monovalent cation/H+ antiporter complex subunit F n=1 Tax=Streptomyces sp. 549 TaxID=3049076 RepID=UPI0024C26007|nr:monovalent cation/H+ antiporter complex subunit F [Streptomyces sp. 549]MDK1476593.1 monovalent cation/H+ antiporter complex subunit F [Streptomyces sp. 549]
MMVINAVLVALTLSLLVAVARVIAGPTAADRLVGADFGFAVFVGGLAVLAVRLDSAALLDLVLVAALVGFLATVALARLLEARSTR